MQSQAAQRHLPIRKEWLAATQEQALEPDRPIIDPHHHLWDRPGNRYLFHDLVAVRVRAPELGPAVLCFLEDFQLLAGETGPGMGW